MASKTPAKKSAKKPAAGARAAAGRAKAPARKPAAKAKPVAKVKPPGKKAKAPTKAKPAKKPVVKASAKPASKVPAKAPSKAPAKVAARTSAKAPAKAASSSAGRSSAAVKPPVRVEVPEPAPTKTAAAAPRQAAKPAPRSETKHVAKAPAPAGGSHFDASPAVVVAIGPFREKLMRKREEIVALYRNDLRLGQEATDEPTEDIVDRANNSYSRELSFSISDAERNLLLQIDEAIRRLDSGAFGRCAHCGRAIASLRLEALPWARLCIDCQELLEKGMLAEA